MVRGICSDIFPRVGSSPRAKPEGVNQLEGKYHCISPKPTGTTYFITQRAITYFITQSLVWKIIEGKLYQTKSATGVWPNSMLTHRMLMVAGSSHTKFFWIAVYHSLSEWQTFITHQYNCLCEIYIITVYISPFNRNVITDTKVLQCDSTIIVLQRDSALWYRRLAEVTETSKFLGIAAAPMATVVTPSNGYNGTSASKSGNF